MDSDSRLTEKVQFRISKTTKAELLLRCMDANGEPYIKIGDLAKAATLGASVVRPVDKQLEKYRVVSAARIGNNINQTARRLNADNLAGKISQKTYEEVLAKLDQVVDAVNELLEPLK